MVATMKYVLLYSGFNTHSKRTAPLWITPQQALVNSFIASGISKNWLNARIRVQFTSESDINHINAETTIQNNDSEGLRQ